MAIVVDDFKNSGLWVKGYRVGTPQYITKAGRTWDNMSMRCKAGGATQKKDPTYEHCSMSDNFHDFQFFATWYTSQVGYSVPDYHLDKDLLVQGNKTYSEDTCVLVPRQLNLFIGNKVKWKGDWPKGVYLHKASGKFVASLNIDAVSTYIGLFDTPTAASQAYKKAKESEARRWYERLKAGEFVVDPRVIECMRTWEHICDWKPA